MSEYPTTPRPYTASAEIVADLPTALSALREALPPGGGWDLAAWAGQGGDFKTRARAVLAEASLARGQKWLAPHRVVEIARTVFPRQTILAVGSGAHALVAEQFWDCYEAKTYLCPVGSAASGYALPTAIAAKLTFPSRPVLAVLGDGGFLKSLVDLATAARQKIPVTAVVYNDGSLSLTRTEQERRRYAPQGVSLGTLEIPKLAEGLGALSTEVEDEASLLSALTDAKDASMPAVISVRIRPAGYRRLLDILQGKGPGIQV